MSGLERINEAEKADAESKFRDCCGSVLWASLMTRARPFASENELLDTASGIWNELQSSDWLEAFSTHPKIGETRAATTQRARSAAWSAEEQAGISTANESVREELAAANQAYYEKFGFILIVCATGNTAEQMLDLCRARLGNDRETEIVIAAAEQQKITEIRLRKLLSL